MKAARFAVALCVLCLCGVAAMAQEAATVAKVAPPAARVAVITINGDVDYGLFKSIERRVHEAVDGGADVLLFEIDTYGGEVTAAVQIGDLIDGVKLSAHGRVTTVAYVHVKAISAGALISLSCQKIVMKRGTTIGDAEAIIPGLHGIEVAPEKYQTMVRALARKYAQSNGHPVTLCEAMVDPDLEVWQVKFPDGRVEYLSTQAWNDLKPEERQGADRKQVVAKGKLLTLSDTEALEYGLSIGSVGSREEALALFTSTPGTAIREETDWSEGLVRLLSSGPASVILIIVGMVALYMAFKIPGLGAPEVVAILCFGLLFFSKFMIGMAGMTEVLLFAGGVMLVAIEIFLIPGFGVVGVLGLLCIVISLILAFQNFTIPQYPFQVMILVKNMGLVFGSLLAATVLFMMLVRFMPKTPFLKGLVLNAQQTRAAGNVAKSAEQRGLIGKGGRALSTLRPSGRAEIAGEPLNVMSDGEYIEAGEEVVVIDVKGNSIFVARKG